MFNKKRFDMLSQSLVPSITKKVNSYSLVLGQQPFIALQIQIFIKVFQCILKSIKTFLIQNYFYSIAKKHTNKTKKNWNKSWSDNRFLNLKILDYFNKIKSRISQLITKVLLKQRSLNQIRYCLTGHNQIWHHFFLSKNIKVF